jgi:hypothetical protein
MRSSLGLPDKSFDYVILSHTLQTVTDPLEVLRTDAEDRRARPGDCPELWSHIVNRLQLMFGGKNAGEQKHPQGMVQH